MIIDPPSVFAPPVEWKEFFNDMERLVASQPNNKQASFWLIEAEKKVAELQGSKNA